MYILKKGPRTLGVDEPIRHENHKRPVTRRDFISQGFMTGPAVVAVPTVLGMLLWQDVHSASAPVWPCSAVLCTLSFVAVDVNSA